MVQVLILRIAAKDTRALADSSTDDEDEIEEGNAENKKGCRHFTARVDREEAEHEPEEHCACVAREHARRRKIEAETTETDTGEHEG